MSRYMMKYKGQYRLKVPYDLKTLDFPRNAEGGIDKDYDDIYIDCYGGNQIYHYGHGILCGYIPVLQRGREIIKAMKAIRPDMVLSVFSGTKETIVQFKSKYLEEVIHLFKPKTGGANISPFSVKNLPRAKIKQKPYTHKSDKMNVLKKLVDKIYKTNKGIHLQMYRYLNKLDAEKKYYGQEYKPFDMIEVNGHIDQAIEWVNLWGISK